MSFFYAFYQMWSHHDVDNTCEKFLDIFKGQEISKANGLIFISSKIRTEFCLNFDLSSFWNFLTAGKVDTVFNIYEYGFLKRFIQI